MPEAHIDAEVLQGEKAAMDNLNAKMWLHVCPVVMLAHSRTNLPAKFRVFLHTLALLSDSRETLLELIKSISSVHTDYGTESGISRMPPIPLQEVLPYWHSEEAAQPAQDDGHFVSDMNVSPLVDLSVVRWKGLT